MTEAKYGAIPGIAMTQWRAGRVLSDDDVAMIGRLLRDHDAEIAEQAAAFSAGYEQAMSECDRADVPTLIRERDADRAMLSFYKACAAVAERQVAELKGRIAAESNAAKAAT